MIDHELRLIENIQKKGHRESANMLIKVYYREIYGYVFKQLSCNELSADITQEIFISMIKSIDNYNKEKCSFRTWLYKISSNKIIDYYRSKSYKQRIKSQTIDDLDIKCEGSIEDDFIIEETVNEVLNIVNSFEANIQQIFRMKIFSDMTFKEIGKVLDLSESTVKTKYYRLIKRIKVMLEECKSNEL
ncbi:RNA polymerase sigma factor [Clostridium septicum]|uniref:Sigma-70 family RNA polymerase sigma factor n=1 Tax=Clostridium septicum TaxID=1504 RepID=A0ABY5AYK3_CLOSE|nr:sigma-70 family RNA polymerase sigma factor [Clostridium septicum]MDU1313697.1 sigma-70 family RNA polymerase sigma factor [Clostridium septicum]UEC21608.1 sigma-70 family RNA polymerase sigma factor [Clostridium septicum]USS00343.1 sigma-70 family RNA polymerase sigma factor [Clostridium septicum]WLF68894.1 sigma-70 family RNA polymerase sigma factor [Clostridium septicum]